MSTNRLYFIDAVRAFAILMMLQGHFIDTLLAVEYRDPASTAFNTWSYFRGITAPIFFTISGLIFTYLLIKAKLRNQDKMRIRKGFMRGLLLIGIGYALRIPVFQWLEGVFTSYVLVVDVLQCIGLSLIFIVVFYKLTFKKTFLFSMLMLVLGTLIFLFEPWYRDLTLEQVPLVIANYMSKSNGSIFTILPWFGYMAYGAFIATLFYGYLERPRFKVSIVSGFLVIGLLLINYSSHLLMKLHYLTEILIFKQSANYNYLFSRLGDVLVIFGLFYLCERLLKHALIFKIGQKTLSIYVIHFIIMYGSFTGVGLSQVIGKTLDPTQAIIGAIIFLTVVCILSLYRVKTNAFVYAKIRQLFDRLKAA